jgi:hypothetical protein
MLLTIRIALRVVGVGLFFIAFPRVSISMPELLSAMLAGAFLSFAPTPFEGLRGWLFWPKFSLKKLLVSFGGIVGLFVVGRLAVSLIDPGNSDLVRVTVDLEYAIQSYTATLLSDILDDRPRRKHRWFNKIKFPTFKPAFRPAALQPLKTQIVAPALRRI